MRRFAGSLRLAVASLAVVSMASAAPDNQLLVAVFDSAGTQLTDVAVGASTDTGGVKATVNGNGLHVMQDVGALGPDGVKTTVEISHPIFGAQQMDLLFVPGPLLRLEASYDGAGIVSAVSPDLLPYPAPTGTGDGAPANDDCANAEALSVGGSASGTTLGATFDDVGTCGTTNTAPGVWYTVEGTGNVITLSTCDAADYDTKISVFCGSCDDLSCIAGNDDGIGCTGFTSLVDFCSEAGATYYVLVHGFSAAQGNFTLSATDGAPCEATTSCVSTGACCFDDGSCAILSASACESEGGEYLGDDTTCFADGGAGTEYGPGAGGAIPDNSPAGLSTTINVGDSFVVGDVDVSLGVTHTWTGDLIVTLEHGGTTATIVDRIGVPAVSAFGCAEDNWADVTLDDEAGGGAIEDQCPVGGNLAGSFTPESPLSVFDGMDAAGDWTLTISDNAAADTGGLNGWSLSIGGAGEPNCEPPECFLIAGDDIGLSSFTGADHSFTVQTSTVDHSEPVLMENIAEFVLPMNKRRGGNATVSGPFAAGGVNGESAGNLTNGAPDFMADGTFAIQVVMWNPNVFPELPEQFTHGLLVHIDDNGRVTTEPYGQNLGGLTVWHEIGRNEQGQRVIRFPFLVPGL